VHSIPYAPLNGFSYKNNRTPEGIEQFLGKGLMKIIINSMR
jgi:hypothetical protein